MTEQIKNLGAGLAIAKDWLGDGLRTVNSNVANLRAAECCSCKLNLPAKNINKLTSIMATGAAWLLLLKEREDLWTMFDAGLYVCDACDCHLTLKVWAPIEHIINHTRPEVLAKMKNANSHCWVVCSF